MVVYCFLEVCIVWFKGVSMVFYGFLRVCIVFLKCVLMVVRFAHGLYSFVKRICNVFHGFVRVGMLVFNVFVVHVFYGFV